MAGDRGAILVVDLAFGDCGKGAIVDALVRARRAARTVVRFNGGPQAGHNVVTPDGRHHTFSQFGSGTFVAGVETFLSRFMLVEPYALFNEEAHLREAGVADAFDRLAIDGRCAVIAPAQQAANRLRELARGDAAHGTCGAGVGEAMADHLAAPELTIRAADLREPPVVRRKLLAIRDLKADQLRDAVRDLRGHPRAAADVATLLDASWVDCAVELYGEMAGRARVLEPAAADALIRGGGTLVFEGAQGVLLDEWFGFHPHTTWSTTTFANADALLDEAGFDGRRTRVGVLRTYFTRHGAGPLVTEDASLRAALPEPHNADAGWQGRFRVGPFDAVAARYALAVAGGVDGIALTHADRLAALPPRICVGYDAGSGERVTDLAAAPPPEDLEARSRLTRWLGRCRPIYGEAIPPGAGAFAERVAGELGARVIAVSRGPRARDVGWA